MDDSVREATKYVNKFKNDINKVKLTRKKI